MGAGHAAGRVDHVDNVDHVARVAGQQNKLLVFYPCNTLVGGHGEANRHAGCER